MTRLLSILAFAAITSIAIAADDPMVASPKHWDIYVPHWGSLEPRANDDVPEFRFAGGTCVINKKSAEGEIKLEWFPEVDVDDALTIHLLTNGEIEDDAKAPYVLKNGVSVTIGKGKVVTRDALTEEVVTKEKKAKMFEVKANDGQMWYPIRITAPKKTDKGESIEVHITINGKEQLAATVNYDPKTVKARRFGFANESWYKRVDDRVTPVSFVRKLQFSAAK